MSFLMRVPLYGGPTRTGLPIDELDAVVVVWLHGRLLAGDAGLFEVQAWLHPLNDNNKNISTLQRGSAVATIGRFRGGHYREAPAEDLTL